jgi:diacylglycerol kinase (ATP)
LNASLIYNPAAGKLRRNPRLIAQAVGLLEEAGYKIELLPTKSAGEAETLARSIAGRPDNLCIVAGGDGTVNEVANGLAGSNTPMAILPGGTANCLAMEIRLGGRFLSAVRRLPELHPKRISLGLCHLASGKTRYFAVMAGAGFDAEIIRAVNPLIKASVGRLAYWVAGFSTFFRTLPEMRVSSNERNSICSFALASRVRNYGGDLEIARNVRLGQSHFGTVLFEGRHAAQYLKYLFGVLFDRHRGMSGVHVDQILSLNIEPINGKPVYLQLDGEEYGQIPARLEIVPDALTIMVPREAPGF